MPQRLEFLLCYRQKDVEVFQRLRRIASQEDTPISRLILRAVREWLRQREVHA